MIPYNDQQMASSIVGQQYIASNLWCESDSSVQRYNQRYNENLYRKVRLEAIWDYRAGAPRLNEHFYPCKLPLKMLPFRLHLKMWYKARIGDVETATHWVGMI